MTTAAYALRGRFDAHLAKFPLGFAFGRLVTTTELQLGSPQGSHESAEFWKIESSRSSHDFYFGFVNNFTPDDLMCKVTLSGDVPIKGAGASLQLNGETSFSSESDGHVAVSHHARITVRSAVSRSRLVEAIQQTAPEVDRFFGRLDFNAGPLLLGTTRDFEDLLLRLFVWSFGVEQAKRYMRDELALPGLPL